MADGRNLSFRQLVDELQAGKVNYCYTIKEDGAIGIERIVNARVTKRNAEVIKVVLDNEEEIICTPEHLFMARDNSYVRARGLSADVSLMPFRMKHSIIERRITIEGYPMIFDPKKSRWIFAHLLADEYNLANHRYGTLDGNYRRHMDFNKRNNNPENIKRMPKEAHLELHRRHISKTLHTKEAIAKCNTIKRSPAYRQKISAAIRAKYPGMLSEKAKKQWTEKFRTERKRAYDEIYFQHSMELLKKVYETHSDISYYEAERKMLARTNKNLLKLNTT